MKMSKTKRVAARMTPLDIEKISRYFGAPTVRNFLQSTIKLSESNKAFMSQLRELIKQNQ